MVNTFVARIVICAAGMACAGNAAASFHLYRINELYSNADGSIQFIEMSVGPFNGESFWAGQSISVSQAGSTHSFSFPGNLPSTATANTSVLIATQGFANLGIVAPDFVIPAGFLFTNGGTLNYAGVDSIAYGALPTDGVLSLNRDGTTGTNSPRNFSGASGTIAVPVAPALNFAPGWNLAGNGSGATLDVAALFGDAAKVATVWKWVAANSNWAFYTPVLADHGAAYAASKGYGLLTGINAGEGFWLNANSAFSAQLSAGLAVSSASFQNLPSGWSLIAIGDNRTPRQFDLALSATTPAAGTVPANLNTLWSWNAGLANWYFYAPGLDQSGGLASYIASKNYLDFGTKLLDPTTGFWVNRP